MPSNLSKKRGLEKQYSQNTLEEAVRLIQTNKISLSKASVTYNIPKGTLHNKVAGKIPMQIRKGPKTLLTTEEESKLEAWIINMAKIGYSVNMDEVRDTVGKLFESRQACPQRRPGRKWMKLYLRRHPSITKRHAEVISKARAAVTEHKIRQWFEELRQFLEDANSTDLMNNPDRIFNLDETGVQMCPKAGLILGPKNYRATYDIASGKEKECLTVLCNFSASGEIVPPFIVYPLKRISKEIVNSVPDDWGIGRSDSGWMTGQTFLCYVKEIFLPWVKSKNIELPILLLVDGHKSHISMELYDFCIENKIILYCLLPNSTHILQPCDVSIFRALKAGWKKAVTEFKHDQNKQITKTNFAQIFQKPFEKSINSKIIKNGFRICGLYPFNPDAVDYSKCISYRKEQIKTEITNEDYTATIKVIEHVIGQKNINKFYEYRAKKLKLNHDLFKLWKTCKNKIENVFSGSTDCSKSLSKVTESDNSQNQVKQSQASAKNITQPLLTSQDKISINTSILIDGSLYIDNLPIEIKEVQYY